MLDMLLLSLQIVTYDTQGEYGRSKGVASSVSVAKELRYPMVMILSNQVSSLTLLDRLDGYVTISCSYAILVVSTIP